MHNLPVSLTSFVGRAAETAQVASLLGRHRLVTVTGPGGSGKTRVAVEVARALVPRFDDGVWLVELAQVEDPELVPAAVAVVLGVREQPGLSLTESMAAVVGARHVLLVLDNCEHVIDAAAGLCDRLLRAGDDLRVLATSREALGVAGEARFPLPPLPVPADETAPGLAGCESVALFVERAGQAAPDFTLTPASGPVVATIVQHLDGMPLAIELAAAQLDVLDLGQLAAGLDDRFQVLVSQTRGVVPRQASLAAAVEWSHRLLSEAEQAAFRRLSVFPAPFTMDAARAAIGPEAPVIVTCLVRRSLLVTPREGPDGRFRYKMLETLRAYGSARLDDSGEREETTAAVAALTVSEAEGVSAAFETPDDHLVGRWGDAEQDNLREVLEWLLENDPQRALRLAIAMGPWWSLRGHYREGARFLERALVPRRSEVPMDLAVLAEVWLGRMAQFTTRLDEALEHFGRAEQLLAGQEATPVLVDSLNGQVVALLNIERFSEASQTGHRALEAARAIAYPSGEVYACGNLAMGALYTGDNPACLAWAQAARRVDPRQVSGHSARWAALQLAFALAETSDLPAAEAAFNEVLDLCRSAGERSWEAMALESLARVYLTTGRWAEAGPNIGEALRIASEVGNRLRLADCLGTAAVWAADHNPEAAAVLWGASSALSKAVGFNRLPIADITDSADEGSAADSLFYTAPMLAVRARLGPQRARTADQRGAEMSFEAMLEFARRVLGESPPSTAGSTLPGSGLTKRERELVALVAQGLSNAQIAARLFISERTVGSHLDRIRDKTGCRRRADLTRLALQAGLV